MGNRREWICVCGAPNKKSRKTCHECGISKQESAKSLARKRQQKNQK